MKKTEIVIYLLLSTMLLVPLLAACASSTPSPSSPPGAAAASSSIPEVPLAEITYDQALPDSYLIRAERTYRNNCSACHDLPTAERIKAFPSDAELINFTVGMAEGAHMSEEDSARVIRYLLALRHDSAP